MGVGAGGPASPVTGHRTTGWCSMRSMGVLDVVFVVQFLLVSLIFLRAFTRSRVPGPDRSQRLTPLLAPPRSTPRRSTPRGGKHDDGNDDLLAAASALQSELEAQRRQLASEAESARSARTNEEAAFRARRREVLLDLHEHRRVANELKAAEPALRGRIEALRTELEHLDRRRPELTVEIHASTRTSRILRERVMHANRELTELRKDSERVRERLEADTERLVDLARRRALLRAETEELAALARTLQEATDTPQLLGMVTDGELRGSAARPVHRGGRRPSELPIGSDAQRTDSGPRTPARARAV